MKFVMDMSTLVYWRISSLLKELWRFLTEGCKLPFRIGRDAWGIGMLEYLLADRWTLYLFE
ncbi:hypothetical protein D3C78_613070 [compost metagenome]